MYLNLFKNITGNNGSAISGNNGQILIAGNPSTLKMHMTGMESFNLGG